MHALIALFIKEPFWSEDVLACCTRALQPNNLTSPWVRPRPLRLPSWPSSVSRVPPAARKCPSREACLRSGRVCFLPVTKPRLSASVKELHGAGCDSPIHHLRFKITAISKVRSNPASEVNADRPQSCWAIIIIFFFFLKHFYYLDTSSAQIVVSVITEVKAETITLKWLFGGGQLKLVRWTCFFLFPFSLYLWQFDLLKQCLAAEWQVYKPVLYQ